MRKLCILLFLCAPVWAAEPSVQQEVTQGIKWALIVAGSAIGGMWLLFAFIQKFGGMGSAGFYKPHKVEDVGPIDRQKSNAFAAKEREAMRQPYVDKFDYPNFGESDS